MTNDQINAEVKGHPENRNNAVEQLLGFGYYCIKIFRRHRNYPDIESEMQFVLLCCLTRICRGYHHANPLSYIQSSIRYRVREFLIRDRLIQISERTILGRRRRGQFVPKEDESIIDLVDPKSMMVDSVDEVIRLCDFGPRELFLIERYQAGDKDLDIATNYGVELGITTVQGIGNVRRIICAKMKKFL